jgi:hypothetical protein
MYSLQSEIWLIIMVLTQIIPTVSSKEGNKKILNNSGPNPDPCGTPDNTSHGDDRAPE